VIEDLLEHIGIEDLRVMHDEIAGRCPMHEQRTGERENHPRHWSINRTTGVHHCFSCEYSGSLVKLIVDVTKVGLWEAYQLLHRFDVDLETQDEEIWVPPLPPVQVAQKLGEFGSPPERAIRRRRLKPATIKRFGVRWDHEESAWVFPIHGPAGDLWGWQVKTADWVRNRPPGIRKSLTLFGIDIPWLSDSVVLVESPLDAMYLDGLGYPSMASFGAEISNTQMRLVIERFDELILALDNDKTGRTETERLLAERWHHRLPIHIFNYHDVRAKDPGECNPEQVQTAMSDALLAAFWSA
jgi:DNA primase